MLNRTGVLDGNNKQIAPAKQYVATKSWLLLFLWSADLAITKNYVQIEKWQEQKFLFSCNTSCIIFYFVREFCVYIFLCILLTYHIQFPSIIEFVWSWALNRLNNIYNNQSNFCSLFWCPDDVTGAQHPSPPPPAATSWPPPPPLSTGTADPASSWNGPE